MLQPFLAVLVAIFFLAGELARADVIEPWQVRVIDR